MRGGIKFPKDGEAVVIPSAADLSAIAESNSRHLASHVEPFLDTTLRDFVLRARAEIIELAEDYTRKIGGTVEEPRPRECESLNHDDVIIATGHEPGLYHPGVWIKNFLAWHVSRQTGCTSINFIADNDSVDVAHLRVPVARGGESDVTELPFIDAPADVAAEEIIAPPSALESVKKAAALVKDSIGETMIDEYISASAPIERLAEFLARPRHAIEESLGVHNLELPVSLVSDTRSFRLWATHIIERMGEFAREYNAGLKIFRSARGIKNPLEPVPDLARHEARQELPFWCWRTGGHRRPLMAERRRGEIILYCGSDAVGNLSELAEAGRGWLFDTFDPNGWKVRPRALALTMYLRLVASDLFIHGLGGSNYEPVNDEMFRNFWLINPPQYAIATATLLVKTAIPAPHKESVFELHQHIRRLRLTPERFERSLLPGDKHAHELADEIEKIRLDSLSPDERHDAFIRQKELREELAAHLQPQIEIAERKLERAAETNARRERLLDRTLPFFFHSRNSIEQLVAATAGSLTAGKQK